MPERTIITPSSLRALRKDHGLTLAGLAARAGVSLSALKYYEAGTHQPRPLALQALARELGVKNPVAEFPNAKGRDVAA